MSVIGTFTPAKDGGWTGSIHTLTINTKVRLVPTQPDTQRPGCATAEPPGRPQWCHS